MNLTSVFPEELLLAHKSILDPEVAKAAASADQRRATNPPESSSAPDRTGAVSGFGVARLIGLMLVSLGPALFWTAGLAFAGTFAGVTVTPGMLAGTFLPVFSFLLLACSPCLLRPKTAELLPPELVG